MIGIVRSVQKYNKNRVLQDARAPVRSRATSKHQRRSASKLHAVRRVFCEIGFAFDKCICFHSSKLCYLIPVQSIRCVYVLTSWKYHQGRWSKSSCRSPFVTNKLLINILFGRLLVVC